ncbi:UDP-glucosyltransferase 2-like isoform X1 [Cydia strobilella]|uniref:UDP-glucosyltransferase 2-like isoform X1 n=1 Tax=Cydia strobilella TaxID=1100964 RepID=UPI0030059CD5
MNRLIALVCALVYSSDAARILAVFPTPSISHQVVFRPLTQELAKRGHEVTVITTDPAFPKGLAPANLREIDVHDISYGSWRKQMAKIKNGHKNDVGKQVKGFNDVCVAIFEKQTAVVEVQDIIQNKNNSFDLLLVEAWTRFVFGFTHVIKTPVIAVSSLGAVIDNYDVMGAPIHPLLYPQTIATGIYNLSFWEKVTEYYNYFSTMNDFRSTEKYEDAVLRRIFGEDTPPLSELKNNIGMMFINMHPIWEGNIPVPPSVIHIGGMHQKPEKDLPQDLKQYLDSSKHGVIYISFGTNVDTSSLPREKVQSIINALSHLPYDVLWKWNQDELPGRTKNIRISKWFPQSDLLRHPKVKLFITQGGLQSTDETITGGVPVIGIPMVGDQFYNVAKYDYHKIGKKLCLDDLNEETLRSAIEEVIENKSYRENIIRLRTLMNDQPMSSLERAIWWTEHVLRHGTKHLRAPAANMHWFEYYDVQLLVIVLCAVSTVILMGCIVLREIVKVVSSNIKVKVS